MCRSPFAPCRGAVRARQAVPWQVRRAALASGIDSPWDCSDWGPRFGPRQAAPDQGRDLLTQRGRETADQQPGANQPSTTDSATLQHDQRGRATVCGAGSANRPCGRPSLKSRLGSIADAWSAGINPTNTPVASESASANATMRQSACTSASRGTSAGNQGKELPVARREAPRGPPAPPASERARLGQHLSYRAGRAGGAHRPGRIANSRIRAPTARAISASWPTLTQHIMEHKTHGGRARIRRAVWSHNSRQGWFLLPSSSRSGPTQHWFGILIGVGLLQGSRQRSESPLCLSSVIPRFRRPRRSPCKNRAPRCGCAGQGLAGDPL